MEDNKTKENLFNKTYKTLEEKEKEEKMYKIADELNRLMKKEFGYEAQITSNEQVVRKRAKRKRLWEEDEDDYREEKSIEEIKAERKRAKIRMNEIKEIIAESAEFVKEKTKACPDGLVPAAIVVRDVNSNFYKIDDYFKSQSKEDEEEFILASKGIAVCTKKTGELNDYFKQFGTTKSRKYDNKTRTYYIEESYKEPFDPDIAIVFSQPNEKGLQVMFMKEGIDELDNTYNSALKDAEYIELLPAVKKLGKGALMHTKNLIKAVLPPNISDIGEDAFKNSNIFSLQIKGTLKNIAEGGFFGCENLRHLEELKKVQYIGMHAFSCSGLKEADLHGAEYIEAEAFFECRNLEYAVINPNRLKIFGKSVFGKNRKIKELILIDGTEDATLNLDNYNDTDKKSISLKFLKEVYNKKIQKNKTF